MTKLVIAAALFAAAGCSKGEEKAKANANEYLAKSKAIEAKAQLRRLSRSLKTHHEEKGAFPAGTTGPLPAEPCCKAAGGKCAPVPYDIWRADPVWSALEFSVDEAPRFQYAYTSDGTTVTATATADFDCDGSPLVYKLVMTATTMDVVEPAVTTD